MPSASKPAIVFLVSHSAPGGVQELWSDLAEGFATRGYAVTLAALYPAVPEARTSSTVPWSYVVSQRPRSPVSAAWLLPRLIAFLRARGARWVVTAMPFANVMAPIASALARLEIGVITSHHSPTETHSRSLNLLDRISGSLASTRFVVSVSEAVNASLDGKPNRYRDKRQVIRNALPERVERVTAALVGDRDERWGRRKSVIAIGRLAPQKNFSILLRAAVHMPDVIVQIVGSGPLEAELKALAFDLGVAGHVRFVGHVSREEALALVAQADAFAQPSLFEGHSLALLEAAKLGLPLVVSDVPVQVEGITRSDGVRCGIVVGTSDEVSLAVQLNRLLTDAGQHRYWSELARSLAAESNYSNMVSAYERLMIA